MSGEELKRDALAKLLCLMDTFAGEGLGHTYGNGQVIDADDVSLELCAAFGMEFDAGWWRSIPDQIFAHPLPEQPQEGVREAIDLVFRIEAAGALEYEAGNFERWKDTARRIAPLLRSPMSELQRMGWQPIETAPKDGSSILLYPALRHEDTCCEGAWLNTRGGPCWVDLAVGHHNGYWKPTHWMPLPSPPSTETKESGE